MADANVPPEAGLADGDAQSTPARRQTLRLRDAENVAAVRLDMFGDPLLKDSLAGAAPGSEHKVALPGAEDPPREPPQPPSAATDAAEPAISALPPPSESHPPALLPPPAAVQSLDADLGGPEVDRPAPGVSGQPAFPAVAEPQPGWPDPAIPSGTDPGAAPSGDLEDAGNLGAPDTADEPAQEERNGAALATGPFGGPFMMPPGAPELDAADLSGGPMNEQPRFRDELMFVEEAASEPIVGDDAIASPDAEPLPPPELPQDPPFIGSPAPPDDFPDSPQFAAFPEVSPFPEPGPTYPEAEPAYSEPGPAYSEDSEPRPLFQVREAPPMAAEPAPPAPSPFLDAAAKIAAEANATAEALDNLKRMLAQKLPHMQAAEPAYPPEPFGDRPLPPTSRPDSVGLRMHGLETEPPPFSLHEPAPLLPLPMPPPRSARSVHVLGFLTGLVLAVMAGLILYFFIVHANLG